MLLFELLLNIFEFLPLNDPLFWFDKAGFVEIGWLTALVYSLSETDPVFGPELEPGFFDSRILGTPCCWAGFDGSTCIFDCESSALVYSFQLFFLDGDGLEIFPLFPLNLF